MNMDIRSLAAGLKQSLIHTLYPPCCVLCGAPGFNDRDICIRCYRKLPWIDAACSQCAIPLPVAGTGDLKCGQCLQQPPAFDHTTSLFRYQDDAIKLIQQLKFNEKLVNARLLGTMLAAAVQNRVGMLPDCVLPVPLHRKRLRQRGFNQSIELARALSKACPLPLELRAVVRVRDTGSQTGLDRQQRRKNIRGAFEMVGSIEARHVAIVDDVVTTTSTVNELACLLKSVGVRRVDVWSIARAT